MVVWCQQQSLNVFLQQFINGSKLGSYVEFNPSGQRCYAIVSKFPGFCLYALADFIKKGVILAK